jgi:hypothetical protein
MAVYYDGFHTVEAYGGKKKLELVSLLYVCMPFSGTKSSLVNFNLTQTLIICTVY